MPHGAAGVRVLALSNNVGATATNALCEDCHTAQPSLRFPTDRAAHPVNTGTGDGNTVNGAIQILSWDFTTNLAVPVVGQTVQGGEGNGNVICMSCHAPHEAQAGTRSCAPSCGRLTARSATTATATLRSAAPTTRAATLRPPTSRTRTAACGRTTTACPSAAQQHRIVCDTCHAAHDATPARSSCCASGTPTPRSATAAHAARQHPRRRLDHDGHPARDRGGRRRLANPSGFISSQLYAGNNGAVGLPPTRDARREPQRQQGHLQDCADERRQRPLEQLRRQRRHHHLRVLPPRARRRHRRRLARHRRLEGHHLLPERQRRRALRRGRRCGAYNPPTTRTAAPAT